MGAHSLSELLTITTDRFITPEEYSALVMARHKANPNRFEVRMARTLAQHEGWTANEEQAALRALEASPATGPKGQAIDVMAIMRSAVARRREARKGYDVMLSTVVE